MAILILGQSGSISSVVIWAVVLLVVAIVGGVVIFKVRRQMLDHDATTSVGSSGLLDHLHQMHKSGQMDDAEFASARNAVLRQVQDDMESQKSSKAKPKDSFLDGLDLDR